MIKQINTFLIVGILLLLTISSIYAQVGSTGLTRSFDAVEPAISEPSYDSSVGYEGDERIATSMIMPPRYWCSFDYSILSNQEIEEIKSLEKDLMRLSNEANKIRINSQSRYDEIYNSIFPIKYDYYNDENWDAYMDQFSEGNWEQYNNKIENLEVELGLTQKYEEINEIQELIENYFDGCYNPYDEEWVLLKLSDSERERYEELQRLLDESYEDESRLYDRNQREFNRIYENSREENIRLEEELGISALQEQIRELQQQVNSIRRDNQDTFNQVWEDQLRAIESLERSSGLEEIREQRQNLFEEIQELTGNNNYWYGGYPITYARDAMETPDLLDMGYEVLSMVESTTLDNTNSRDRTNQVPVNVNYDMSLKEMCELNNGRWLEEFSQCEFSNPAVCSQMGGEFNECGSACRNDPDAQICTLQCVPYCDVSNVHSNRNSQQESLSEETQNSSNDEKESLDEDNNNSSNGFMSRIRSFFASIFSN
ncbi:MAG: hypothetical protein ACMXYB_03555 [Candidatus Woesearchaeota archaeon]